MEKQLELRFDQGKDPERRRKVIGLLSEIEKEYKFVEGYERTSPEDDSFIYDEGHQRTVTPSGIKGRSLLHQPCGEPTDNWYGLTGDLKRLYRKLGKDEKADKIEQIAQRYSDRATRMWDCLH
tara:strand:- start:2878 stop:3246 length:369 start_codon:yes stop_codon:yes gene_type:complete